MQFGLLIMPTSFCNFKTKTITGKGYKFSIGKVTKKNGMVHINGYPLYKKSRFIPFVKGKKQVQFWEKVLYNYGKKEDNKNKS